jgi:hypothetical protein
VHGVLQQTPSTQNAPTGHDALLVHASPRALRARHMPASQKLPRTHSSSFVHGLKQPPEIGSHSAGAQSAPVGIEPQVPRPSQTRPLARFPEQLLGPHATPGG